MNQTPATEAAPRPRWIDTRDVAKLIRKHLKKNFPGVKFSVRIDRYAGGSSVDVVWTDGPTKKDVEAVTGPFQGNRFDGSIDLQFHASQWYCDEHGALVAETYGHSYSEENGPVKSRCCAKSELVHMGAGYVMERRDLSEEFTAELAAQVRKESGMPAEGSNDDQVPDNSIHAYGSWTRVWDAIHRLSQDITR